MKEENRDELDARSRFSATVVSSIYMYSIISLRGSGIAVISKLRAYFPLQNAHNMHCSVLVYIYGYVWNPVDNNVLTIESSTSSL